MECAWCVRCGGGVGVCEVMDLLWVLIFHIVRDSKGNE